MQAATRVRIGVHPHHELWRGAIELAVVGPMGVMTVKTYLTNDEYLTGGEALDAARRLVQEMVDDYKADPA